MRTVIVPAEVTSVEDRIIGSLGFAQVLLLLLPVFTSAGLFAVLPPVMEGAVYKYIFIGFILLICSLLTIRIKGIIAASWLLVLFRYWYRPTYYVFMKASTAFRVVSLAANDNSEEDSLLVSSEATQAKYSKLIVQPFDSHSRITLNVTKKGVVRARISQKTK